MPEHPPILQPPLGHRALRIQWSIEMVVDASTSEKPLQRKAEFFDERDVSQRKIRHTRIP